MQHLVVVEEGENGFGAYVPDLPGCIAAAETKEEVLDLIREAIEFHIEGLKGLRQDIPEPSSTSEVVEIGATCTQSAWSSDAVTVARMVGFGKTGTVTGVAPGLARIRVELTCGSFGSGTVEEDVLVVTDGA